MQIRPLFVMLFALLILAPPLASAAPVDATLTALKEKLDSYAPVKPVAATFDIRQTSTNKDGDDATTRRGHVRTTLHSSHDELVVRVPASEFDRASAARKASVKDAKADTTSAGILDEFSLTTARTMLDFAPTLRRVLAAAKLTGKKDVTRNGQPAKLLLFDLPKSASAKKDDDLKDFSSTLKLWLDANGVPLALQSTTHSKYRKFLISFSTNSQRSCDLVLMGKRLICRKRHEESGGAGMGQSGKTTTESTLSEISIPTL